MGLYNAIAVFLAAFYTFVAVYYTLIIGKHQREQKQTEFIHMGRRYSLHWWNHLTFRCFRIAIWAVCVVRVPFPNIDQFIGVFQWPSILINLFGLMALVIGFGIAIATHHQMQLQWRSGIDQTQTGPLLTEGVYARSRNPAYIGVATAQIGFALVLPSVFSLICLVVGLNALRVQINLEEAHLRQTFGEAYTAYQQAVPRWL